jgi:hypothetical protein
MKGCLKPTSRSWKRLILFSFLLVSIALMIPTMTAFADDCLRDPLNAADCLRTPGFRQVITIGIGIAGTAGVVIQNVITWEKLEVEEVEEEEEEEEEPEKEEEEPEEEEEEVFPKEDPCKGARDDLNIARTNMMSLLASREHIQNYLTMLETQFENARQSSYWSGAVNVALLEGSVFERALRGVIGFTIARSLAQNVAVSMATALGSTVAKQVLQTLAGAGIKPEDLVKGPMNAARITLIKDAIKDTVMREQMRILARGLDPNGPVYQAVKRGVDTNWAGPAAELFGDTLIVMTTGVGIIDGVKKQEVIRGLISRVRSRLSNIDLDLMDARSEISLSQHSLDLCVNSESYAKYLRRVAFSRLPS